MELTDNCGKRALRVGNWEFTSDFSSPFQKSQPIEGFENHSYSSAKPLIWK